MPCKYSEIFGKPGEGIHSIRFLGVAVVDFVLTVLLGIFINHLIEGNWKSLIVVILFVFSLGVIVHKIFCVNSTINKMIFS